MIKAQIAPDFPGDGIAVRITLEQEGGRLIMHVGSDAMTSWEPFSPQPVSGNGITMHLQDEAARALLDALLRYYEGASDMHTVRSDLLHERGRVDRLTDALIRMTAR